ncbi:uncharacterized protein LOC106465403 isoform X2 [Limulus polyphemus]|uniref:Uncharacterized protein LOC106465403 isoform X2 n=1 Tax=Limulus polyphemus TaxID=6850 RepID=A0ABM1SZF2_LIMPO|nr:uncharacterized protein LOC106465403 isoform X2 [Limulus polyphemus]
MEPQKFYLRIVTACCIFFTTFSLYLFPVITLIFICVLILIWSVVLIKRYHIWKKQRCTQLSLTLGKLQQKDATKRTSSSRISQSPSGEKSDEKEGSSFSKNIFNSHLFAPSLHLKTRIIEPSLRSRTSIININTRLESKPNLVNSSVGLSIHSCINSYTTSTSTRHFTSSSISPDVKSTRSLTSSRTEQNPVSAELIQNQSVDKQNFKTVNSKVNCVWTNLRPENPVISLAGHSSQTETERNSSVFSASLSQMPTAWLKHYSKSASQPMKPLLVDSKCKQVKRKCVKNVDSSSDNELGTPKTMNPTETAIKRRRIFLTNQKRYPVNQDHYSSVGLFPSIHFQKNPLALLDSRKSPMAHRPVTVKIAPPDVLKNSSSRWNYFYGELSKKSPPSPSHSKIIIAALRESRKRSLKEKESGHPKCDLKRQKQDSKSSVESDSVTHHEESLFNTLSDEYMATSTVQHPSTSMKRPVTLDVNATQSVSTLKRQKNNAIFSSYSSSRSITRQKINETSESSVEGKLQEVSRMSFTQQKISEMAGIETRQDSSPSFPKVQNEDEVEGLKKRIQEERASISLICSRNEEQAAKYKPLGYLKASSAVQVASMPEHLSTLEEHERDSEMEEKRLQKLLQDVQDVFKEKSTQDPKVKSLDSSVQVSLNTSSLPFSLSLDSFTSSRLSMQSKTHMPIDVTLAINDSENVPSVETEKSSNAEDTKAKMLTSKTLFLHNADRKLCDVVTSVHDSINSNSVVGTSSSTPSSSSVVAQNTSLICVTAFTSSEKGAIQLHNSNVYPTTSVLSSSILNNVTSSFTTTRPTIPDFAGEFQFGSSAQFCMNTGIVTNSAESYQFGSLKQITNTDGDVQFDSSELCSVTPTTTSSTGGFHLGSSVPTNIISASTNSSGGFHLGSSVPTNVISASTNSSGGFQFGSSVPSCVTPASTNSTGGFQFGSSVPSCVTPASTNPTGGFQFGSSIPSCVTPASTNPAGGFQFGFSVPSSVTPVSTSPTGGFQFGSSVPSNITPASTSPTGGFQFGSSVPSSVTPASTSPTGGFQFGSSMPSNITSISTSSTGGFQFGSSVSSIGTSTTTTFVGGFHCSSSVPSSVISATRRSTGEFQFSSIPYSVTPTATTSAGKFQFGSSISPSVTSTTTNSTGGFQFGSSISPSVTSTTTNSTGGFQFGSYVPLSVTTTTKSCAEEFQCASSLPATTISVGSFIFGSAIPSNISSTNTTQAGGFQLKFGNGSNAPSLQPTSEAALVGRSKYALGTSTATSANNQSSSQLGKTNSSMFLSPNTSHNPTNEKTCTPTLQKMFDQTNQIQVQGIFGTTSFSTGGFNSETGSSFQNSSALFGIDSQSSAGSPGQNLALGVANPNSCGSSNNTQQTYFGANIHCFEEVFGHSSHQSTPFSQSNFQQVIPSSLQYEPGSKNTLKSTEMFNFSSVSQGATFNFSAKPNQKFRDIPTVATFGNHGSRPGTPQGGALFSVGANSRNDRRLARRRQQKR